MQRKRCVAQLRPGFLTVAQCSAIPQQAFSRALRYHLGSAALGGAVLALLGLVKLVFLYVQARLKGLEKAQRARGTGLVSLGRVVLFAVHCCIKCLDGCAKFVTRNAYLLVAMRGTSFCAGAKTAVRLVRKRTSAFVTVALFAKPVPCTERTHPYQGSPHRCIDAFSSGDR